MANALGVRFNATSTGTGDFVDASLVTGYRRGASILVDGSTYRYRAENSTLTEYEWGTGVWTSSSSTLARTTIFASSTGSKVSFTSVPQVAVTIFPDDIREVLIAARDYYVRTDGSDSNTGLANTAGGAFLTIGKALTTAAALDCSTYQLTINVAAGTYTVAVTLPKTIGSVTPILTGVGNTTIISTTAADGFTNDGAGVWQVNNLKLTVATSGNGITLRNGGIVKYSGIEFGAIAGHGIACFATSSAQATGSFSVSGSASSICFAQGYVNMIGQTITFSNSPAFSTATFYCFGGYMDVYSMTFTNGATVTGKRYDAEMTGAIFTNGGGANYVPGNVAGTTATGGQYA